MMGVTNQLDKPAKQQQNRCRSLLIMCVQKAEAAPVQEFYRLYVILYLLYPALAGYDVILESGPAVTQQSTECIKSRMVYVFINVANLKNKNNKETFSASAAIAFVPARSLSYIRLHIKQPPPHRVLVNEPAC